MKVTIVADNGEVMACIKAHLSEGPFYDETFNMYVQPRLIEKAGQSTHELVVPDELEALSGDDLHNRLAEFLPG